jgi:signal transduction histidine kinase/ActR/RegA family two-component response regulator
MRTLSHVVWVLLLAAIVLPAQLSGKPKHVLVLHWYDRDFPANSQFDQTFQAALRSGAPEGIEYFSEYLDTNRFPGENQSQLLSSYLQQKYAARAIDVVVSRASPPLEFLLKHRSVLLPDTPIVFATNRPVTAELAAKAGATGLIVNNYRRTLDLALSLHPRTDGIFFVSGTLTRDKAFETIARNELGGQAGRSVITYLTDLTLEELTSRMRTLPRNSLVLYGWQQALTPQGRVAETSEILGLIAREAAAPVYVMSNTSIGLGAVGGYVWTFETLTARLAEIALRVANGTRSADIRVERAPAVAMFDWRQLQRFGIRESQLPPHSDIRFREFTFWQLYKSRIVAAFAVFLLQAVLIGGLLVARQRSRRAQEELRQYKERLEQQVQERTVELVEARDQALAANRTKTLFLAQVSHELRTPLNAILGFSDLVLRDPGLPEQHRKDLTIVGSSGEHLLGLVDDVLDIAKIEAGGAAMEIVALDLHAIVTDTVRMLRERAQDKNLELFLDIAPNAPRFIRSDRGKLRQVFTNLIANALKYTDEGSVAVRLDGTPGDNSGQTALVFEVEDTGIGIAEEDWARIFDAFVQAGLPRARKGVGLGLSISRHFVELLGGTIQVESTVGRGSRFRVETPAQVAESHEAMAASPGVEQVDRLAPGQPDVRILIVEDGRENWLLLQRLLAAAGFRTRVAEDGAQALEEFRLWRPHFIWMDLRLPVLDGMAAAKRIRRLEGGQDVKIVALTASAFASQREEVLSAGFDDFLRKPYRAREIFDCMGRHLGVRYRFRAEAAGGAEPAIAMRPSDLATLPSALRDDLENAVVLLDPQRISGTIARVSEVNARVGAELRRLADRFAYTTIHEALQTCKNRPLAAGS